MNKLTVFTRSYIRDDGSWDLSNECIDSMTNLLTNTKFPKKSRDRLKWIILVSNLSKNELNKETIKVIQKLNGIQSSELIIIHKKLSCSEARLGIYEHIIKSDEYERGSYYMNLDSDDWISDSDAIYSFINSKTKSEDLIGFGLDTNPESKLREKWTWDEYKFDYSRRYITTETQTMFLFLHTYNIIKYAMTNKIYLRSYSHTHPNESCDDTLMALEISQYNECHKLFPIRISAICANFIHYNEHPGQVSENQISEYKDNLGDQLKDLGYLYVNHNFYKINRNSGRLVSYTPIKPQALSELENL